ncbi:hypothetical protein FRACA_340017 [Frankia canadensis]|uniref:Uncharacterized protein n=1 Tax=Frankia canadensis TaxID=1836972 RepID=A0A2I2KV14_9ACTN|nr:hypothetical protein FRACA_340017 [Frankia canadensis]SOU56797.1 hypothetical protein FRACA_340017 [Frankia canadensis]
MLAEGNQVAIHFEASLERGRDGLAVLEQARTQLAYGRWLRRERRVPEAREQLSAALCRGADPCRRPRSRKPVIVIDLDAGRPGKRLVTGVSPRNGPSL